MKYKLLFSYIVLMLICSGIAVADQKVISSESDFTAGTFSSLQLNIEPTSTSCNYIYTSAGYGFYTSGQHGCDSGAECDANGLCQENFKRVFVTSSYFHGNLGGLSGADQKCNAEASTAGLGGTWTAWLSTSSVNAKDRITDSAYYLVDETTKVCDNLSDLCDGTIQHAINLCADGTSPVASNVWTGTSQYGTLGIYSYSCNGWTTQDSSPHGYYGRWVYSGSSWTDSGHDDCFGWGGIYCFED